MLRFAFACAALVFMLSATPAMSQPVPADEITTQLQSPPHLTFVASDGTTHEVATTDALAPAPVVVAAAPASTSFAVDISETKDGLWALLAAIIVVVSPWLTVKILAALKQTTTGPAADILESALRNGLNLAIAKAQEASKDWKAVNVKNEIVADGLNYVLRHAADEAASLGITQSALIEKLKARLAGATNAASGAPSVKPAS